MSYISDDTRIPLIIFQTLTDELDKEQSTLHPVTEMTKDLLKNITAVFSVLEEIKKVSRHICTTSGKCWTLRLKFVGLKLQEFETQSAQLDGAKLKLFKRLNNSFQKMAKAETVSEAEEHAEELSRVATESQQ